MRKSFMNSTLEQRRPGFKESVWIFCIACFIGYVLETVYCIVVNGHIESRQGLIYGPFTQVYGIGALVMCFTSVPASKKGITITFIVSALIGGLVEFSCSLFEGWLFGSQSWDFSYQQSSIGGRTSLFFMLIWGLLGCAFACWIYPLFGQWTNKMRLLQSNAICFIVVIFFMTNFLISGLAVSRWMKRLQGFSPKNTIETFMDAHYPNQLMEVIYPDMRSIARK